MGDRLEGRNPVLECLNRGRRRVLHVWLDRGAKADPRITSIVELCAKKGIAVERVERRVLDKLAEGRVHNGVIADAEDLPTYTVSELLDQPGDPFLVIADELAYEHNLGAILRSALGFGVTGVILPTRRGAERTSVVQRVAMGAAEEVAVAHDGLYSALAQVKRAGIRVVGADMGGVPIGAAELRGPLAVLLGSEGEGLSEQARSRCDLVVSIPLAGKLESLNVSVAAAVLLYEKRRQDGWFLDHPVSS